MLWINIRMEYKQRVSTFESRLAESQSQKQANPTKLPAIIERAKAKDNRYFMPQNKFLISKSYTFHEFSHHLRSKLKLNCSDSLYLVVGDNIIPSADLTMSQIYEANRDPDGFLYLTYSSQQAYG